MFRFVPYVLKSLWGHRTRTLLTISGAAVAMFVFYAVGSVQEGLRRLSQDRESQRTLIVFQENRFCPTSSRLPQDYADRVRKMDGVRDVMPIQVWTNNCRASLDVVVFNGVEPVQLRNHRHWSIRSGSWEAFESRRDSALVGQQVATRRGLSIGSQFSIGEISVNVAGIFQSPTPSEENLIYTHLSLLQYTPGIDSVGMVTQLEVALTENADADKLAKAIDEVLKTGPVATTTRLKGAFQTSTLSDLIDLIEFAHWLGYACIGLVLALVGTTTVMSVQDRVKEHAVLQTIGLRPMRVFRLIVAESLLLCLVGGFLGTVFAAAALAYGGFAVGVEGVAISFRPSWSLAATCIAASVAVGLAAGFIPAWQSARLSIVSALRAA